MKEHFLPVELGKAYRLINHGPTVLVASAHGGMEDVMAASWAAALAPQEPAIRAMGDFLRGEVAAGRGYQPAGENVFRALRQPLEQVKVLQNNTLKMVQ